MEPNKIPRDHLDRLALRMQRGDRKAVAALYDELLPKVYGFFFARTGKREASEDLSQEIFLKLILKISSFDKNKGKFTVWFWQVARRHLIDHYRAKQEAPFSSFEESDVEAMAVAPGLDFHARFAYRELRTFLVTLEDEERELFEMRFVAEIPYREISAMTGKQESTLRVAALRIKSKIKQHLQHIGENPTLA
jgi:RNA polymerase sigma-70 factor (ECF subfamily)